MVDYEYIHIFVVKVMNKSIKDMANSWKYEVGCSGSGWGVWNTETHQKVEGFMSAPIGRFYALKFLYILNGWDWNRSKYVKEHPSYANLHWGELF